MPGITIGAFGPALLGGRGHSGMEQNGSQSNDSSREAASDHLVGLSNILRPGCAPKKSSKNLSETLCSTQKEMEFNLAESHGGWLG